MRLLSRSPSVCERVTTIAFSFNPITWKKVRVWKGVGWGGGGGAPLAGSLSEARQEVCDSHGGGGPVALLHAAVLAEGDVEALVNKRLVGVVVVGQQSLPELALVHEGPLQHRKPGGGQREEVSRDRGGGADERDDPRRRAHGRLPRDL